MLDDLELLDDTTPPDADAAMLARVRGRARRRRRRNRLVVAGAIVASLAVAFGTLAVVRNRNQTLDVTPTATTTPSPTTAAKQVSNEAALPNGFRARMTVENPTVALGDLIRARVELRNDTAEALGLGGAPIQCELGGRPELRDAAGKLVAEDNYNVGHGCGPVSVVNPGRSTSVAFTLSTDSVVMPHGQHSATYDLFVEPNSVTRISSRLGPVPVEIVVPDLPAHIELPATTFTAGSEAKGTLVVDNRSSAVVHYSIDCNGIPPYDLELARDGVTFHVPQAGVGRLSTHQPQYGIGPGTHRFPFRVGIAYTMCGDGSPTVDSPRCQSGVGIPPLAPGDYQIVYSGTGAFGSLVVAPVTIHFHVVVKAEKHLVEVVSAPRRRG